MRNYAGRLAKLEAALLPPPPMIIRIEYVQDWRGASPAPVAVVAPGLIERLQDDQLESIVTQLGGDVAELYRMDDAARPPLPAVLSSPGDAVATTGTLNTALPGDPPKEEAWSFERAMYSYREPEPGPNLRRMRVMARKGRR